jgi:hypothetical protein
MCEPLYSYYVHCVVRQVFTIARPLYYILRQVDWHYMYKPYHQLCMLSLGMWPSRFQMFCNTCDRFSSFTYYDFIKDLKKYWMNKFLLVPFTFHLFSTSQIVFIFPLHQKLLSDSYPIKSNYFQFLSLHHKLLSDAYQTK